MYCTKCGNKLDDNARFCSSCGAKIDMDKSNVNLNNKNYQQKQERAYTMYEEFEEGIAMKAMSKMLNKVFGNSESQEKIITKFVITDKSLIANGKEYTFEQMGVIYPTGSMEYNFIDKAYSCTFIETNINGEIYSFRFQSNQRLRFYFSAIKANEHIKITSKKQRLQYIGMLYSFLLNARLMIKNLPITFDKDNKFDEFDYCNERVIVNADAQISKDNQKLIYEYTYAQESLDKFFKNNDTIPHVGHNRDPKSLVQIAKFMLETDEDTQSAIKKYNQYLVEQEEKFKRELEEDRERRAIREANCYESNSNSSGSMLGDIMKTATGVALGNKMSGNTRKKGNGKPDLMGSAGCYYGRPLPGSKSSFTIHCDISCPLYGECARGRGR